MLITQVLKALEVLKYVSNNNKTKKGGFIHCNNLTLLKSLLPKRLFIFPLESQLFLKVTPFLT